jgi:hypothetical protein
MRVSHPERLLATEAAYETASLSVHSPRDNSHNAKVTCAAPPNVLSFSYVLMIQR